MRHTRVLLIALMVPALVAGSAFAQVADVPADHWAYRAVLTLVERGYIDLAGDGAFRGDEPADRYSLAAVVGRLLEDIEAGRVRIREGTDAELVRRLEQEFRAELVAWHAERDALQEAFGQTQRAVAVIDAQLNDVLAELELLAVELADLAEREAQSRAELQTALSLLAEAMEEELAERDIRLDGHDTELANHHEELARHHEELERHSGRLSDHDAVLAQHGQQLAEHEDRLNQHASQLQGQAEKVEDLYSQLTQSTDDLSRRLQALQTELESALEVQGLALGEELSQRLGEQRSVLQRLQQDVAGLQARLDELALRMEDEVQSAINRLEDWAAAMSLHMNNLETSLNARLDREVEALSAELEAVRDQTGVLDQSLARLRQLVDTLSAQQRAADEQLAAELAEQQGAMDQLRSRLEEVAVQAAQADVALGAALSGDITALNDRLDRVETVLAEQRELLRQQTEALMGADRLILQEIESLRQEVQALRGDVQTLRQRTDTLEGNILANQAAITALREDLDTAVAQTRVEQQALRRDLDQVRAAVEEVQVLIGSNEEYLSRLVDELQRRMDTQLSASVLREQQLQRQLRELEAELNSLRSASQEEMSSLRGTGTLAVGAAVLAILLGVTK